MQDCTPTSRAFQPRLLTLAAVFAAGAATVSLAAQKKPLPKVAAPAPKAQPATPQKWEYCFIISHTFVKQKDVGLSTRSVPVVVIYFTGASEEVEGASYDLAIGSALAKLGDDGWELVAVREGFKISEGTGSSAPVFYLKRPKRQE